MGLALMLKKCVLGVQKLSFRGYFVNKPCIQSMPMRVTLILNYNKPKTIKDAKKYLGLLNYIVKMSPRLLICRQLKCSQMSDKSEIFSTHESSKGFEHSKCHIANANLLFHFSPKALLVFYVDTSDCTLRPTQYQCGISGITHHVYFTQINKYRRKEFRLLQRVVGCIFRYQPFSFHDKVSKCYLIHR